MQVALLLGRQLPAPARRTFDVADAWGDCLQDRVDDRDCFVRAAHHQAVAALQPEDSAAGPDVDIVDALLA